MLIYPVLAVAVWAGVVWFLQRQVLFPRWAIPATAQVGPGRGVEVWTLDRADGPVEAWFLPGEGRSADAPGPAVIFAHGNAELIDHWPDEMRRYRQRGISVLLPEYRGYGRSAGTPTQQTLTEDFTAFYDRLAGHPSVDPAKIILHGRSVGGGVIAQLAARRPSAGMVLESTFTSVRPLAARYLVPGFMVRDPFDTLAVVQTYAPPLLVMHGTTDRIIPPSHADALHAAAPNARLVHFPLTGHNDPPPANEYWTHIDALLRDAGLDHQHGGVGVDGPS